MTKEPVKIYTINEYDIDPDDHMMHFTQSFVFYHSIASLANRANNLLPHMPVLLVSQQPTTSICSKR